MPTIPTLAIALSSLFLSVASDAAPGRPGASPDIVPDGHKSVSVQTRVELGPFAARAIGSHIVEAGETLSAIAQARLGSAARWKEIAALNPTVDPSKLSIDARLAIPPREPPGEGEELLWVFAESAPGLGTDLAPLEPDGSLHFDPRYARFRLHLVPMSVRSDFDRVRTLGKGTADALAELVRSGRIHSFEARTPGHYIPRGDPTARRIDVFRIEEQASADGKTLPPALVHASSSNFDADGKPVIATRSDRGRTLILVLLLSGIAGAGLLVLAARRRELRAAENGAMAA